MTVSGKTSLAAARARVSEIRGFYLHLIVFVITNVLLLAINLVQNSPLWFHWVLIFWAIGLGIHAVAVYGRDGFFGRRWEEEKIRQILDERKED